METHGCTGWRDNKGRLVIRTSSQVPFLVRDELRHIFGLDGGQVHVFTKRVGGGFGDKQEMLTEDLVALAVMRLGRHRGGRPRGTCRLPAVARRNRRGCRRTDRCDRAVVHAGRARCSVR
jgi:xanthine dehydrogenase molybdopterin-binding subunit B